MPITFAGFEQQQQQRIVDMVVAGDTLYYTTYDKRLNANRESITGPALYRSDGTVAGTQKLLQIDAGTAEIHKMIFNGDKLFFSVFDRTSRTPGGLWTSDGTITGTAPLADATGQLVGQSYGLFDFNGLIVFGGGPTGFYKDSELWRSDGTPAGTYRIKDIKPGPESSSPNSFTVFNNLLYFTAGDNFENETEAGTFGAAMVRRQVPSESPISAPALIRLVRTASWSSTARSTSQPTLKATMAIRFGGATVQRQVQRN